jgi:hypothetical protein
MRAAVGFLAPGCGGIVLPGVGIYLGHVGVVLM